MVTYAEIIDARRSIAGDGLSVEHVELEEEHVERLTDDLEAAVDIDPDGEWGIEESVSMGTIDIVESDRNVVVASDGTEIPLEGER